MGKQNVQAKEVHCAEQSLRAFITDNIYALFSHMKKAYTANQNEVQPLLRVEV